MSGLLRPLPVSLLLLSLGAATMAAAPPDSAGYDFICGPRCTQYVLRYYGIETDLAALVAEMQPDASKGSSFADIVDALESRGIKTLPFHVDSSATFSSSEPVILHLHMDSGIGHFVVLLPQSDDDLRSVWVGLSGIAKVTPAELARSFTGAAILTSRSQVLFQRAPVAIPLSRWASVVVFSVIAGAIVFATIRLWSGTCQNST